MEELSAADVNNYLRSLCDVKEPSVDRVIIGDPTTPVKKIGTCWTPCWETLKTTVSKGINTLIVHEPTFYHHWDLDVKNESYLSGDSPAQKYYSALRDDKIAWVNKNSLVIIRCHDVWDKKSETGIPFALGKAWVFPLIR